MLPIIRHTLNELRTLFQKSWEWRIGYVLIGGFIAARWLGLFSSLELITLDFFLSHRLPEERDDHVVIVLIDETNFQGDEKLTDAYLAELLEVILAADPAVVGLNIFRERSEDALGRSRLVNLFETHDNLIGVQKVLPPREIPPLAGVSKTVAEQQFGINDIPIDRDGKIRRVFIGTYLPDETPDIREDNPFKFSFSFEIAEKYLAARGYSLENLPADPVTPSFKAPQDSVFGGPSYIKIPRLRANFGGYVREKNIADIQTLLNFRAGTNTFAVFDAESLLNGNLNPKRLLNKAIIIGTIDPFFPRFLPVSASSNLVDEDSESLEIFRIGVIGTELEAHSTSQVINTVLDGRPLINAVYPLFEDTLIILSGI
ncbi:MAG: CHASE2 domain-containing protein, partial [Leptolyngbya sp. SIO1D8]|nr:CHASE2 domain-containing protein [Leptolyngbya sp. SIO1D8]